MTNTVRLIKGICIAISYLTIAYFLSAGRLQTIVEYLLKTNYNVDFVIYFFIISALANLYIGIKGLPFNILWHVPLLIITLMLGIAAFQNDISFVSLAVYGLAFVYLGIDCYQDYKYGTNGYD